MTELFQYIVNGLASGSLYVLLAVGFTLVFGVMGMMNVAHADLYMIAVFTLVWVGQDAGLGNLLGFLAGVAAAIAVGFLIFVVVLRRIDKSVPLALFVGTLGVSYFIENLIAKIVEFRARSVHPFFQTEVFLLDGVRISNSDLLVFAATLAISFGLLWWLKSSTTGRLMRAVSESPRLSEIVAINTTKIMGIAVVIASAIAGVGGLLTANKTQGINPFVANDVSLKMFAVAIVAGIGSVGGALIAGLALGVIESLTVGYIGSTWQNVVGLAAMVVVLLVRPQGIFGRVSRIG
ncbi:MAG: ABC-type transporter, integral rane subunit [Ilumatobacteraceae bacterium]|nr:ABC-type transporter, integral rane subunit [Ilumatobacteraceae bacterium]